MTAERERAFFLEGVVPSFPINEVPKQSTLGRIREIIVRSVKGDDDVAGISLASKDRIVPSRRATFHPSPEPPLGTLVRDMPNFSVGRTSR